MLTLGLFVDDDKAAFVPGSGIGKSIGSWTGSIGKSSSDGSGIYSVTPGVAEIGGLGIGSRPGGFAPAASSSGSGSFTSPIPTTFEKPSALNETPIA